MKLMREEKNRAENEGRVRRNIWHFNLKDKCDGLYLLVA